MEIEEYVLIGCDVNGNAIFKDINTGKIYK